MHGGKGAARIVPVNYARQYGVNNDYLDFNVIVVTLLEIAQSRWPTLTLRYDGPFFRTKLTRSWIEVVTREHFDQFSYPKVRCKISTREDVNGLEVWTCLDDLSTLAPSVAERCGMMMAARQMRWWPESTWDNQWAEGCIWVSITAKHVEGAVGNADPQEASICLTTTLRRLQQEIPMTLYESMVKHQKGITINSHRASLIPSLPPEGVAKPDRRSTRARRAGRRDGQQANYHHAGDGSLIDDQSTMAGSTMAGSQFYSARGSSFVSAQDGHSSVDGDIDDDVAVLSDIVSDSEPEPVDFGALDAEQVSQQSVQQIETIVTVLEITPDEAWQLAREHDFNIEVAVNARLADMENL